MQTASLPANRIPEFPPELLLLILEELAEDASNLVSMPEDDIIKTLRAVAMVNHFLRDHALPYLYSSVRLIKPDDVKLFARTVQDAPELADLVRSVVIWESPPHWNENLGPTALLFRTLDDYEALESILRSLGSLRRFYIERPFRADEQLARGDPAVADSRKSLETVIMTHSALTLEEFASVRDDLYLTDDHPESALAIHSLRNLRRLHLCNPTISTEWIDGMHELSQLTHFCATDAEFDGPVEELLPLFIEESESLEFLRFILPWFSNSMNMGWEAYLFFQTYKPPGCILILERLSADMSLLGLQVQLYTKKKLEDGSIWSVDPPPGDDSDEDE